VDGPASDGPPLTPVCDALSSPIIIIMTVCSSSSSTRYSSSGAYVVRSVAQFAPCISAS
jgi:hypothetical protein